MSAQSCAQSCEGVLSPVLSPVRECLSPDRECFLMAGINLAQDRDKWRTVVNNVMKRQLPRVKQFIVSFLFFL